MDLKQHYQGERERIEHRRATLGLTPPPGPEKPPLKPWGLALSGGGIRSATFCLGVLQAMTRARAPEPSADKDEVGNSLLPRFDYLSTVSGGGYIGSFFASLFIPDRLRKGPPPAPQTARAAAANAYKVLHYEPPGRISTGIDYLKEEVGMGPTAWLRENGRYLTPTGSGDTLYALAITWRNWLSLHFVIGMPIVLALTLLMLLQLLLVPDLYLLPAAVFVLGLLPCGLAYWLVLPQTSLSDPPALGNLAAILCGVAAAVFLIASPFVGEGYNTPNVGDLFLGFSAIAFLGLAYAWGLVRSLARRDRQASGQNGLFTVRNYRVEVTRLLARIIMGLGGLLFAAFLVSLSETLYLHLKTLTQGTLGILPVLIWLVRRLALLRDEKTLPDWLRQLPLDVMALLGGILLLAAVCLAWMLLVVWVSADGSVRLEESGHLPRLVLLVLVAAGLTWVSSRFVGFLNTSSLQSFYSARLVRAYMGASNGKRFNGTTEQRRKHMSVAEPLRDDDISVKDYYDAANAGPLHLINVTMNLTVDPAEQLVQRDRKGKPLCLAPGSLPDAGTFLLDGKLYPRKLDDMPSSEIAYPLTIGQWIGVSGAAFTTGLGRATNLGMSLLLGLANIRLGNWWPGCFDDPCRQAGRDTLGAKMSRWLPTHTYLFYELTAHFHGHRRTYQYLSDGGHFENTAAYELLRKEREVELIVLCDCGCDPDYQFEDLSNLIRLARIDHGLEIREDTTIVDDEVLKEVFGTLAQLKAKPSTGDRRCALLLNVYAGDAANTLVSRILVLKPRLIASVSLDVQHYAQANPAFPNQTTVDQFFDEAQFESYRQLGRSIGLQVFGGGPDGDAVANALWAHFKKTPAGAAQAPSCEDD
ncbi:membrane protein [Pseudomonas sp. MRSN 12121]|uniref:membrane protein n=1 Tax=Pseudomonas sp. MRSN 12121 TaxID=1611770 RepID=UPI0005CA8C8A|nr:membrane protein [Pseudomonas sp. MRSN 12121]